MSDGCDSASTASPGGIGITFRRLRRCPGTRSPSARSSAPALAGSRIASAGPSKATASMPHPMSPPTADGYTSRRVAVAVPTHTSAARCMSGRTAT
jgi:hypothetical protein